MQVLTCYQPPSDPLTFAPEQEPLVIFSAGHIVCVATTQRSVEIYYLNGEQCDLVQTFSTAGLVKQGVLNSTGETRVSPFLLRAGEGRGGGKVTFQFNRDSYVIICRSQWSVEIYYLNGAQCDLVQMFSTARLVKQGVFNATDETWVSPFLLRAGVGGGGKVGKIFQFPCEVSEWGAVQFGSDV